MKLLWVFFKTLIFMMFFSSPILCLADFSGFNDKGLSTSTIISLTNQDREDLGLKTLHSDSALEKAAQMKAEDMASKGYFSHETPSGQSPWYWFGMAGYNFQTAGENLALNFSTAPDVEKAWMESPSHKANIVNKSYSEIGIGIAHGTYKGVQTTFVVQLFGTKFGEQNV